MTKAELVDALAEETELSKRQVGEIVDLVLDEIRNALVKGDKVQLIPFGSFVVRDRKKREGRNPKTGEKLIIAARKVPAFTAGKGLRDAVAGGKKRSASAAKPAAKSTAKKKKKTAPTATNPASATPASGTGSSPPQCPGLASTSREGTKYPAPGV